MTALNVERVGNRADEHVAASGAHDYSAPGQQRLLFGLRLDAVTLSQVLESCGHALRDRREMLIGVVNAAKVVKLRSDTVLRDSLLDCSMLLADGQSVVWASRLLRRPLPERVAGIDLFESLLGLAERDGHTVYLLGAKPEVLNKLIEQLSIRFPRLQVAGKHDGYFADDEAEPIAAEIRESHADMLFLGMVTPKKEIFLAKHRAELGVPILHGVGGSFDILAGVTKRAPLGWQRSGMEWAFRLIQEPRRMWRRYLRTNTAFLWLVLREALRPTTEYGRPPAGRIKAESGF